MMKFHGFLWNLFRSKGNCFGDCRNVIAEGGVFPDELAFPNRLEKSKQGNEN
jgi:hypothetical protein